MLLLKIEKKENNVALTIEEFKKERAKESPVSNRGDCPLCPDPIIDQLREDDQYITIDGKRVLVHTDCYNDMMGREIEEHPILMPRKVRGT